MYLKVPFDEMLTLCTSPKPICTYSWRNGLQILTKKTLTLHTLAYDIWIMYSFGVLESSIKFISLIIEIKKC